MYKIKSNLKTCRTCQATSDEKKFYKNYNHLCSSCAVKYNNDKKYYNKNTEYYKAISARQYYGIYNLFK